MYSLQDKTMNYELITNEIISLGDDVTYKQVAELLPKLIADKKIVLDTSVYSPADPNTTQGNGVGRFLIYDHPDKKNPFSIWVFAFGSKQKTCIHDHQYKGTVMVLDEPISEKLYAPTHEQFAKLVERSDRYRFHTNQDDLQGHFVHQLKRRKELGEGTSHTLHIYNMEARVVNLDNIVDRRNIKHVYFKDVRFNKTEHPAYKQETPLSTIPN